MKQNNGNKFVLLIAIGFLGVGCSSKSPIRDSTVYGKKPLIVCKETHTYKQVGDLDLKADVYRFLDDKIRPAVVHVHGGDLIHGDRTPANFFGPVYETSINSGNVLVSIDYRLAPQTKIPEIVRDVEDAINWFRRVGPKRFNVDPNQVVVMGESSGAYLALVSGYRVTPPPKAIVSLRGGACPCVLRLAAKMDIPLGYLDLPRCCYGHSMLCRKLSARKGTRHSEETARTDRPGRPLCQCDTADRCHRSWRCTVLLFLQLERHGNH